MGGFVYILRSEKNGRFYIGSTLDLDRRLREHNLGKSKYTSHNRPFILVFSQQYLKLEIARKTESWLKKQKDRKLIERIIASGKIDKTFL